MNKVEVGANLISAEARTAILTCGGLIKSTLDESIVMVILPDNARIVNENGGGEHVYIALNDAEKNVLHFTQARKTSDCTLTLCERQYIPMYTVELDGRYPYALVLKTRDARNAETREGYYDTHELHADMKDNFGPDVQHLSSTQFQQELDRRLVHTSEVVALLKRDGDLLGQDLSHSFVYGSFKRPMSSIWARVHEAAVYIQTDKQATGYHTYVAVPAPLDDKTVARYELAFVSHP